MPTEDMMLRMLQAYDPQAIYPCLDTVYSKNYSNTNFSAGGQDVHVVRAIVSEREEQTNLIDAIIERTETILVQLRGKRKQLVSSKKVHTIFLSCIRRLPSEVLREIFLQCVPLGKYVRPLKKGVPLLLTQICRRWREIALDTPRLWCSLFATPRTRMIPGTWNSFLSRKLRQTHQTPPSKWEPYLPFYDDWLKRAKCCPLSLNLDISKPSDTPNLPDTPPPCVEMKAAIDLFKLYTSRSRELTLSIGEADLSLLLQDVPILEYLSVKGNLTNLPTLSIVQPQPRLRTLIISSPGFGDTTDVLSTFNPGWTNLTHLTMMLNSESSQGNMFLKLIQTCPNLERLAFSPARIHPHDNPVSLTHSNLRVLEVCHIDLNNSLTDRLTLPNLCSLHVDSCDFPDDNAFCSTPLGTFNLAICSTYLNPFTLFNLDFSNITQLRLHIQTPNLLLQVIQLCPNLDEAVISFGGYDSYENPAPPPFTHYQLRSLTLRDVKCPLGRILDRFTLPSLRNLKITYLGKQRWPHGEFKKFFSRSRFLLERLTIEGMMMYNVDKSNFTRLIPTLEDVEIRKYVRSDSDTGTRLLAVLRG